MKRACETKLEMFVVSIASSLFIICAGCSSGGATAGQAVTPVSIPKASRSVVTEADTIAAASANNARDLASAQPDSVLSGGSARDVDLGGGGNAANGQLTYQTLGETLQKIGLNAEDNKDCYVMKVKATTEDQVSWTFPIAVSLSPDQTVLWITCPLAQIDKSGAANSQTLFDLLSANYHLGTSFFVLDPKHFLVLQQPLPNLGVTPQILGSNLKIFFSSLKQSEPLFKNIVGVSGGDEGGKNPFQ
jgi:hypothetical protein